MLGLLDSGTELQADEKHPPAGLDIVAAPALAGGSKVTLHCTACHLRQLGQRVFRHEDGRHPPGLPVASTKIILVARGKLGVQLTLLVIGFSRIAYESRSWHAGREPPLLAGPWMGTYQSSVPGNHYQHK